MLDRKELIEKDEAHCFSHGVHLTQSEVFAEKKLYELRNELMEKDPNFFLGQYYDKVETVKTSRLY